MTSDGTAQAGVDYAAASGTFSFEAGASSGTVEVAVLDGAHNEGKETLSLTLSNATSGWLADGEHAPDAGLGGPGMSGMGMPGTASSNGHGRLAGLSGAGIPWHGSSMGVGGAGMPGLGGSIGMNGLGGVSGLGGLGRAGHDGPAGGDGRRRTDGRLRAGGRRAQRRLPWRDGSWRRRDVELRV